MHFERTCRLLVFHHYGHVGFAGCRQRRESRSCRKRFVIPTAHAGRRTEELHVPPGFEIQLVASEPDIHKPMNMAFDDRGRLWVTEHGRISVPGRARTAARRRSLLSDFQRRRPGRRRSRLLPTA